MYQAIDPVFGQISVGRIDYAIPTTNIPGNPVGAYGPKFPLGVSHQFTDPVLGAGEFVYLPIISGVLPGYAVTYNSNPVTSNLTFTAVVASGATSGTLTGNFSGTTGSYNINFSNGESRVVTLTNGSTAVAWTGGTVSASTAYASISPASNGILNGAATMTVALAAATSRGNVAIATIGYDATVGGVQYAWYQVQGTGLVYTSAAITANAVVYPSGTAGQVYGTVSATNQIDGLNFTVAVLGAGLAYGQLNNPIMQGHG